MLRFDTTLPFCAQFFAELGGVVLAVRALHRVWSFALPEVSKDQLSLSFTSFAVTSASSCLLVVFFFSFFLEINLSFDLVVAGTTRCRSIGGRNVLIDDFTRRMKQIPRKFASYAVLAFWNRWSQWMWTQFYNYMAHLFKSCITRSPEISYCGRLIGFSPNKTMFAWTKMFQCLAFLVFWPDCTDRWSMVKLVTSCRRSTHSRAHPMLASSVDLWIPHMQKPTRSGISNDQRGTGSSPDYTSNLIVRGLHVLSFSRLLYHQASKHIGDGADRFQRSAPWGNSKQTVFPSPFAYFMGSEAFVSMHCGCSNRIKVKNDMFSRGSCIPKQNRLCSSCFPPRQMPENIAEIFETFVVQLSENELCP